MNLSNSENAIFKPLYSTFLKLLYPIFPVNLNKVHLRMPYFIQKRLCYKVVRLAQFWTLCVLFSAICWNVCISWWYNRSFMYFMKLFGTTSEGGGYQIRTYQQTFLTSRRIVNTCQQWILAHLADKTGPRTTRLHWRKYVTSEEILDVNSVNR